jgi:hypothetical protein
MQRCDPAPHLDYRSSSLDVTPSFLRQTMSSGLDCRHGYLLKKIFQQPEG